MAKELSTTERLKHTLAQWSSWEASLSRAPDLVEKLDGKSNDTFLVAEGSEQFVVRINSPSRGLGVDRLTELLVLEDIAQRDYAPSVIFGSEEALVTRYVSGGHPARNHSRAWLGNAGRLFRAINSTPTQVTTILDPRKQAMDYFNAIENPGQVVAACFETLMQKSHVTYDEVCLCHNDLLFQNIICNEGGWIAIDWEYARLGDPAFDLAVFVETIDADDAELEILLDAYGSSGPKDRISYYRDLYRLIEVLWWRLRLPDNPLIPELTGLANRLGVAL
jgi:thiamine kinase-like enzyme